MTEISPSLLLNDAAQPANGTTTASAKAWYGGDLTVHTSGVFAGASVAILMTPRMPPNGKIPANTADWMADADWVQLGDPITEPGRTTFGHINPCMLAVRVAGSAGTSRIKALFS